MRDIGEPGWQPLQRLSRDLVPLALARAEPGRFPPLGPHGMLLRTSADRNPRAVVGKGHGPVRGPAGAMQATVAGGAVCGRPLAGRPQLEAGESQLGWGQSGGEWLAAGVAGSQRAWLGQGPEFSGCRQRLPCGPLPGAHCRVFRPWARERPPVDRAAGSRGSPVALRRSVGGSDRRRARWDGADGAIRLVGRSAGRLGTSATFSRGAAPGGRGAA